MASPGVDPNSIKSISEKIQKDAKETEENYREALSLAQNSGKPSTEQIIGIKNNLAWLLYNFSPSAINFPIGFDKQTKDKFDALNKTGFYKRINEAEGLYSEAIKDSENIFGSESDILLLSAYNFAEFQLAMGNFENAIPQYEKCISIVEKKYGKNSQKPGFTDGILCKGIISDRSE